MAKSKEHIRIGALSSAIVGGGINFIYQLKRMYKNPETDFDLLELFKYTAIGAGIGMATGTLPDIFEPATHPHHRKIFHSLAAVGVVSASVIKAYKSNLPKPTKCAIITASAGFISHLILDSKTTYGLPLI